MLMTQMFVSTGKGWNAMKAPLELAEQRRRIFLVQLKAPVSIDDLLAPKFWVQCKDLKTHDRIEVVMPNPTGGRDLDFDLVCASVTSVPAER